MLTAPPLHFQKRENFPETNDLPSYADRARPEISLRSAEDFRLPAGRSVLLRTGLAVFVPAGYELQIRSESGLAATHGVCAITATGMNEGELLILVTNVSGQTADIAANDVIAQGVIAPAWQAPLVVR